MKLVICFAVFSLLLNSCSDSEPEKHRSVSTGCDDFRPTVNGGRPHHPDDEEGLCWGDSDCTDGVNGRCVPGQIGGGCTYDLCSDDSDCSHVCYCESEEITEVSNRLDYGNRCVTGNCRVDADCGDNLYCSPSFGGCGAYSGVVGYYCHTKEDTCLNDSECDGRACVFLPESSYWACGPGDCAG